MTAATRTILIADDDSSVTTALSVRLTAAGFRCLTARTGSEALACFDQERPDLVICDLRMPDGDGATLAECIRATSSLPIILITGAREEFRRRLRRIKDVSVLWKPFLTAELLELVEASLVASDHRSDPSVPAA